MKYLVQIIRVIVGVLFIVSGFVKVVDPKGSQYKFEEYFSASVFNIESFVPFALQFAIVLIIAEIVLGFALLVGWKTKFTVKTLLVMIVFFTFLTGYSAVTNKVTDCGCFGDAFKLTPWQSFYKDVFLTLCILIIHKHIKLIKPINSLSFTKKIVFIAFAFSAGTIYHVLKHLPLIDFRPYKIGTNIEEGMIMPKDGSLPKIHDFMLEDTQNDLAPLILKKQKVMLIIVYNMDKSELQGFKNIKQISQNAIDAGYTVYGVSASFEADLQIIKNKFNLPFDFLFCDETTLKTMIRANPGIVILNKGTIVTKKNWRDISQIEL